MMVTTALGVQYPDGVLQVAQEFVKRPADYLFTEVEKLVLRLFFSNVDRNVFFMHTLPPNVGATLLAMYSRMKNRRGLRGVFVDSFLPQFLVSQFEAITEDPAEFLRSRKLTTLDKVMSYNDAFAQAVAMFTQKMSVDPDFLAIFADSQKARMFLAMWLDTYGHNSIARMASMWLCLEHISLLAAKTLEWGRPGAGYIELSTRYVDMSGKDTYPIEEELEEGWGIDPVRIRDDNALCFDLYRQLAGEGFGGVFPEFLRGQYGLLYARAPRDLETGVIGETCDVLGNLLPASALTSMGINVSGEAFPQLLGHLLFDATPENLALAELIFEESQKVGAVQFARHCEPTDWTRSHWQYLSTDRYADFARQPASRAIPLYAPPANEIAATLGSMFALTQGVSRPSAWLDRSFPRSEYDKLPSEFEVVTLPFWGIMSFRGWRDLQRMSLCTHFRTLLTPQLGFYSYDKPAPEALPAAFKQVWEANANLYAYLQDRGVPGILAQYPLALGNRVGFSISANLRQWEFCTWQRTKFSVNHEVRQAFLSIEQFLRSHLPWWASVSRADVTPAYVFARGEKGIPLTAVSLSL